MNIYKKLLKVQEEIVGIGKEKTNPFYKSKYFDINQLLRELKPVLHKQGLLLLQPLVAVGEKVGIETSIVDTETGDKISETTPIVNIADAQKMGGSITYFRRYALQSLFALEALDDDGNTASGKAKETTITDLKAKIKAAEKKLGMSVEEIRQERFNHLGDSKTKSDFELYLKVLNNRIMEEK